MHVYVYYLATLAEVLASFGENNCYTEADWEAYYSIIIIIIFKYVFPSFPK